MGQLGDFILVNPVEAELTEVERPGVGPRPPHDDEVGDFSWPGQAAVVQGEAVEVAVAAEQEEPQAPLAQEGAPST